MSEDTITLAEYGIDQPLWVDDWEAWVPDFAELCECREAEGYPPPESVRACKPWSLTFHEWDVQRLIENAMDNALGNGDCHEDAEVPPAALAELLELLNAWGQRHGPLSWMATDTRVLIPADAYDVQP